MDFYIIVYISFFVSIIKLVTYCGFGTFYENIVII